MYNNNLPNQNVVPQQQPTPPAKVNNIDKIVAICKKQGATDIHLAVGQPPICRINGDLLRLERLGVLSDAAIKLLIGEMLPPEKEEEFKEHHQADFAYQTAEGLRLRINAFMQRKKHGVALRILNDSHANLEELGLPKVLYQICNLRSGLVLVTGPTGSGKSTTLSAMIDYVNEHRACHILTMEDPIEYTHNSKKSLVNQREVGDDTLSYADSLKAALREDPDVILVGEMRDLETISIATTAAETGHLVFSTLHTLGAAKTIDRLIDVFPPHQQQQVRVQLAGALKAVISQRLLPKADGSGRCVAYEIMLINPAISSNIRDGKTAAINNYIQTGTQEGMILFENSLANLVKAGILAKDVAFENCNDADTLSQYLRKV